MTNKHDVLAREIGCLVCGLYRGVWQIPADIHHPSPGRKRISDKVFLALCAYHHRAVPPDGLSIKQAEELYGPSLATNKRAFVEAYGTEMELFEMSEQMYARATSTD